MKTHLIWIDMEMTGLDPEKHFIVEIASIITDRELNILAEGPDIAIHQPDHLLSSMDGWSREHHTASGLMDRVKVSSHECRHAEDETLDFLSRYCTEGQCPLCGNSVWQDRRFMIKHMPRLEAFLHYRNIDVSSIKELVKSWYPGLPGFKKQKAHLAMSDIEESIKELRYYREKVFVPKENFE